MNSELSYFALASQLQTTPKGSVTVWRETGFCSKTRILEYYCVARVSHSKMEYLIREVDAMKLPFACLVVYGRSDSCAQWVKGSAVSEFNYALNDDAHYVLLILPHSIVYSFVLTSDLESRS